MIDIQTALEIAAGSFPNGPEAVAEAAGATVLYSDLKGCEGWCVRGRERIVIRINKGSSLGRQRFTLAHELSHIVLDSTPDVWNVDSAHINEEETVNQIAAEMLLPATELQARVGEQRPVSQSTISKIARDAKVSEMMVARRIVTLRESLQIDHAFLAVFIGGRFQWAFPQHIIQQQRRVSEIYFTTAKAAGESFSYSHGPFHVTADIFSNPLADTLLVQSLASPVVAGVH